MRMGRVRGPVVADALRAIREVADAKSTELDLLFEREKRWLLDVRERSLARIQGLEIGDVAAVVGLECPPTARKRPRPRHEEVDEAPVPKRRSSENRRSPSFSDTMGGSPDHTFGFNQQAPMSPDERKQSPIVSTENILSGSPCISTKLDPSLERTEIWLASATPKVSKDKRRRNIVRESSDSGSSVSPRASNRQRSGRSGSTFAECGNDNGRDESTLILSPVLDAVPQCEAQDDHIGDVFVVDYSSILQRDDGVESRREDAAGASPRAQTVDDTLACGKELSPKPIENGINDSDVAVHSSRLSASPAGSPVGIDRRGLVRASAIRKMRKKKKQTKALNEKKVKLFKQTESIYDDERNYLQVRTPEGKERSPPADNEQANMTPILGDRTNRISSMARETHDSRKPKLSLLDESKIGSTVSPVVSELHKIFSMENETEEDGRSPPALEQSDERLEDLRSKVESLKKSNGNSVGTRPKSLQTIVSKDESIQAFLPGEEISNVAESISDSFLSSNLEDSGQLPSAVELAGIPKDTQTTETPKECAKPTMGGLMSNIVTSVSDGVAALFPSFRAQPPPNMTPVEEAAQDTIEECRVRKDKVEAERRALALALHQETEAKQRRAEENRKRQAREDQRREEERRRREELREKRRVENEAMRRKQKEIEDKRREERIKRLELHKQKVQEEEDRRRRELQAKLQGMKNPDGPRDPHSTSIMPPPPPRTPGSFFATPPHYPKLDKTCEEISCYEMTCERILLADESSDEETRRRRKKKVPTWAQGPNLVEALEKQPSDPDVIFQPEKKPTVDLVDVFKEQPVEKRRYRKRTSSGNWLSDRLTVTEEIEYRKRMGIL